MMPSSSMNCMKSLYNYFIFLYITNVLFVMGLKGNQAITLNITPESVQLKTAIFQYFREDKRGKITIDLYSMLHIGDKKYFSEIEQKVRDSDFVLVELITSINNLNYDDTDKSRKRLVNPVYSIKTQALATEYSLCSQLEMNYMRPNWFIADLEAEQVSLLENSKTESKLMKKRFWSSVYGGRASEERLTLKKFFLGDSFLTATLRLLCWTCPCPELSTLLVDWSRAEAGGIPEVIGPILQCVSQGKWTEMKRIIFGQELLTGLIDSGDWGGASQSNINVRVNMRNQECCRVLTSIIQQEQQQLCNLNNNNRSTELHISILYGAYHIKDLSSRLQSLGFEPRGISDELVAWDIPISNAISTDYDASNNKAGINQILLGAAGVILYLLFGAIDWYILLKLLADCVKGGIGLSMSEINETSDWSAIILASVFLATYIQRHSKLFYKASNIMVEWEQGLFSDTMRTTTDSKNTL